MIKKIISSIILTIMSITVLYPSGIAYGAGNMGMPYSWSVNMSDGGEAYVTPDNKCVGGYSLALLGNAGGSNASAASVFLAEQGKEYNVSFWAKSDNVISFKCDIGDTSHNLIPVTNKYNWTKFKFTYTHKKEESYAGITFNMSGNGVAYIDAVCVQEKGSTKIENRIKNPSFEFEGITDDEFEGMKPGEKADKEYVFQSFETKQAMPFLKMKNFLLDGELNEWDSFASATLPKNENAVESITGYAGISDLSAEFKTAYDEENIYIAAKVTDDVFCQKYDDGSYWLGDSIQLAIGSPQEDFGIEIGFYMNSAGESKVYSSELQKDMWGVVDDFTLSMREKTKCMVTRGTDVTTYEIVIPWALKFEEVPEEFLFNILINDDDDNGEGRGYIEWTPGIGSYKSNVDFVTASLIEDGTQIFGYIDGEKSIYQKTDNKYELYVVNDSDEEKQIEILVESESKNITLPGKTVYLHTFNVNTDVVNEYKIQAEISSGNSKYTAVKNITVNRILELWFPEFEKNKLKELYELREQCHTKNINTDYEDIYINTIDQFIEYGLEDLHGGRESRAEYVYECLEKLYAETKETLLSYLDGSKQPNATYYYTGNGLSIENQAFYGETENSVTGEKEVRPVFLSGYLGSVSEAKEMVDVGANIVQFEAMLASYVRNVGGLRSWDVSKNNGVDASFEYVEGIAKKGERSLKVTNNTPASPHVYASMNKWINLKAGKTYQFSLYAKADNAKGCYLRPCGWNAGAVSLNGTYNWKKFTYEFTPETDISNELLFIFDDVTGAIYLDDIKVVEKGTKENLITQGSFEEDPVIYNGYVFDVDRAEAEMIGLLDECYKNNMVANVLLSVHYFPDGLISPEDKSTNNDYFIQFDIYNPEAKKVVEAFIRGITPIIKDHPALQSICISNEPVFKAGVDESNTPAWHEYLKGIYGNDLSLMNKTWNENFASFEEVPLQEIYDNTVMYYDYIRFNDRMFADWHKWIADMVKEEAPEIPVHAKIMPIMGSTETHGLASAMVKGTDPELFAEFCDINGNDAWNFVRSTSNRTAITKSFWYDLQTSFKNAPVFNSEDHIIEDRDETYTDRHAIHSAADLWQGAVHGRSAATIWIWARTLSTDNQVSGNIKHRPDVVALEGRTMLDLNRLSKELVELQNEKPKVAVMYSYPSRHYSLTCMNATYQAYEALSYSGLRTKFVSEDTIKKGALDDIELLIVPNAVSTTSETIQNIRNFIEKGGRVILLGDVFLYDTHKNTFADRSNIDYILNTSYKVSGEVDQSGKTFIFSEDLGTLFRNTMKEIGSYPIEVIDKATGEAIQVAEWCYAECDDGILVNICLYDWSGDRTIEIRRNGEVIKTATELISGKAVADEFVLKTSVPALIKISD